MKKALRVVLYFLLGILVVPLWLLFRFLEEATDAWEFWKDCRKPRWRIQGFYGDKVFFEDLK